MARTPQVPRAPHRRGVAPAGAGVIPLLLAVCSFVALPALFPPSLQAQEGEEVQQVPAQAFALSAVLPGTGHYLAGRRRWAIYLAADLAMWFGFSESRRTGRSLEEAYRDLAWMVARARPEPRRDGDWNYYEKLGQYGASGALDADPSQPGIQPERDPSTHNGAIWALAQALYFPPGAEPREGDPAWERAVEYYLRRGIPADLAWNWRENEGARDAYGRLIADSDRHLRRSVGFAGVLLANRVLSVVDLYVASRSGREASSRVRVQAWWEPGSGQPGLHFRIPIP